VTTALSFLTSCKERYRQCSGNVDRASVRASGMWGKLCVGRLTSVAAAATWLQLCIAPVVTTATAVVCCCSKIQDGLMFCYRLTPVFLETDRTVKNHYFRQTHISGRTDRKYLRLFLPNAPCCLLRTINTVTHV